MVTQQQSFGQMSSRYTAWIRTHVPSPEYAFGNCLTVTKKMQEAFPELTTVYGNYYCLVWGKRWHQWLVTPAGEIVDPTAQQFPSRGTGEYVARTQNELPVGKCANCGEEYYEHYDGTVCSERCGNEFVKSLTERW